MPPLLTWYSFLLGVIPIDIWEYIIALVPVREALKTRFFLHYTSSSQSFWDMIQKRMSCAIWSTDELSHTHLISRIIGNPHIRIYTKQYAIGCLTNFVLCQVSFKQLDIAFPNLKSLSLKET